MRVTSHGAAGEVTGSCHLLEAGNHRVLIDCGLFQGGSVLEARNHEPFGFDPAGVSRVFLTHAHLDHCGRLPLLVKRGFRGKILATSATAAIARYILLDCAHLMREDYVNQRRRNHRRGAVAPVPLYDEEDVFEALSLFEPIGALGETVEVGAGLRLTPRSAGHILGSVFFEFSHTASGTTTRVTFGGDLGNPGRDVMPDYAMPSPCDVVYCESTYGDRQHRDSKATETEFSGAVQDSLKRGGNVIIPSFALERAQDVLYELKQLHQRGGLPAGTGIYLNSPLAINITRIYQRHPQGLGARVRAALERGDDPFCFPGVAYTKTEQESRELNGLKGGSIFIAGSGMCNGGRVLHHLRHNLWREEASVILVGYQAKDSLGRLLVEGRESVKIFGEEIFVRAKIYTINGFSAHADQHALLRWIEGTQEAEVRLVHGEANGFKGLQRALAQRGRQAVIVEDAVAYDG